MAFSFRANRKRRNGERSRQGSGRKPSLNGRHMDERPGGKASLTGRTGALSRSSEDVIADSFLVLGGGESLGLEVEHHAVAPALRHQLLVRAELDHPAVLEHADAVGVADS